MSALTAAAVLLAAGLILGAAGWGRLAGVRGDTPAAAVVGLHALWWPAALVGLVSPVAAAATVLALAAAGLAGWAPRPRAWRAAAALGGLVLAGTPIWAAPPVFYDALAYHLGAPWSWLVNGSMAPVPHHLFTHFPLAASVVFLGPVRLGLPEAAAGLHWAVLGLAAAAAHGLARRLGAERTAWAAAACTAGSWHALWIAGVAAADQFVVLAVAVAAAELLPLARGGARPPWLAGAALGLGLAVKYTAAVPVAALLLALLVARPRAWRAAALAGTTAGAAASFWYARNLVTTGNPFFPLAWSALGGRGWDPVQDARYLAIVREGVGGWRSVPAGIVQLLDPARGLGWWLAVAAVLATGAVAGVRHDRGVRFLALATVLTVAGWLATSHTTRYALVLAPLVGALAALGLAGLGPPARRIAAAGLALAVGVGAVQYAAFALGGLGWWRWWRGPEAAEAWRHRLTVNDPLPAYRLAGRLLPAGARVLVVGDARPWGLARPHHASSAYDRQLIEAVVSAARDADEAAARLRALGFSHLAINWGELERLGGPPYRLLGFRTEAARRRYRELLLEHTVHLASAGPVELRTLR